MTGCVSALIDYAFQELRINRIELRAATGNDRSLSIAKRLGFTQEGIHRDAESLNDHSVDQVVYSILKREWDTEQDEGMGYTIINSVEEGVFYLEANPPSREEFLTSF